MSEERLVELMVAYQAGDLAAFRELYVTLADELRGYFARTRGDAARDLVQDLFLEIHRSRRSYSRPLPVRPWVYGIARHVAARSASPRPESSTSGDFSNSNPSPADALDLEKAITSLPASTRDPWLMHHLGGLSFDSIAARLGISVMAAKLRSSRATRALRLLLGDPGSRR